MRFPLAVKTQTTAEVYRRFSWYVLRSVPYTKLIVVPLQVILLLFCFLGPSEKKLIFAFLAFSYPIVFWITGEVMIRQRYRHNPLMQAISQEMTFGEDYFDVKTPNGTNRFTYGQLTAIHEAKQDFYLMLGRNTGLVLPKNDCPAELIAFLRRLKDQKL